MQIETQHSKKAQGSLKDPHQMVSEQSKKRFQFFKTELDCLLKLKVNLQ